MTKKKVLHVTYDMRIGGTEMVIKNIIEGSDSNDLEMSIFCIEEPIGPWGKELQENGTSIFSKNRKPGFDFSLIGAIREVIKKENIDVVHCHQYTPWVYGVLATIGLGKKVIFTEHGRFYPDSSSWKRRFINPVLSFFTDSITAISKATKQALVDYEFLSEKKIEVIYNGIQALPKASEAELADLRKKHGLLETETVLGTVARLDPIKNHEMMINSFNEVLKEHPNTTLIIVGDGDLMSQLTQQCEDLGISEKVIFTGYITKPGTYIQLFDIFLLSSLSEGTSMTLLEAMSVGKPCVVTDAGGNKEIVDNGLNGLVSDNKHLLDFASNISEVLFNLTLSRQMSLNASKQFVGRFNQNTMIINYNTIYKS
ncbi:MAG: glycosyltransferase [Glaciecola sp.]|jgi:glycosyltransferase involved in cell wall biosynthesis